MGKILNSTAIKFLSYFISIATIGLGFLLPSLSAALASSAIIVLLACITEKESWHQALAFCNPKPGFLWFVGGFLIAALLVSLVIFLSPANMSGQVFRWQALSFGLFVTVIFQSFTEEVLFRVFFLRNLLSRILKSRLWMISIFAFVFSFSHWINYRLSEGIHLSWAPLVSLFFLGCASSLFFLKSGHIFAVWGFHAGWNFIRFSATFYENGHVLPESQTFEVIEGSVWGILVSLFLLGMSLYQPAAEKAMR